MNITFFSVAMSVLFSTAASLAIHLLRRRVSFLRTFGVHTVLFIYALCIVRMVLAIEMPATTPVAVERIYNPIYQPVREITPAPYLPAKTFSPLEAALAVWLCGSAIMTARFIRETLAVSRKLGGYPGPPVRPSVRAEMTLEGLRQGRGPRVRVLMCQDIDIPAGVGLFRKRILLPDRDYEEDELRHILRHEYTHFLHHDLWVKALIRLYCCVFWWNPVAYMLRADVNQILEIKCDMAAAGGLPDAERLQYLKVILNALKKAADTDHARPQPGAQLFSWFSRDCSAEIKERFRFISRPLQRTAAWHRGVSIAVAAAVFLASYSFILLPHYDPDDIPDAPFTWEVDTTGAYIQQHAFGAYELVFSNNLKVLMSDEAVRAHIDAGFPLKSRDRKTMVNTQVRDKRASSVEIKVRVLDWYMQYRRWDSARGCWLDKWWINYSTSQMVIRYESKGPMYTAEGLLYGSNGYIFTL